MCAFADQCLCTQRLPHNAYGQAVFRQMYSISIYGLGNIPSAIDDEFATVAVSQGPGLQRHGIQGLVGEIFFTQLKGL